MAWQTATRKVAAWVVGIGVCVACTFALLELGRTAGVKVEKYYDPPIVVHTSYDDEEIDHEYTLVGKAAIYLSLMIAVRVGWSIHRWSWKVHETEKGRLQFRAWFQALLAIGVYLVLVERAFRGVRSGFWLSAVHTVLQLGGIAAIGRGMWLWYDYKTRELTDQSINTNS